MVFFITAASLRHRFGVTLIVSRHSERWQECCSRKTGNGTVTQSEESMILMTSYGFPTTGTDPSHSLRMTPDRQLILTHTKIRYPSHLTSTVFYVS